MTISRVILRSAAALLLAAALFPMPARADILPIGQFTGDHTESFNEFSNTLAVQSLPVFGSLGTLNNVTSGGAIKVEFSSSLNGDLVTPISGMMAGQLGIADWRFNQPLLKFGGFWENNSGANDATVSFYDSADNLLGTAVANVPVTAQHWTWNGWSSDIPISRVHVVGNGLINGFIWYENMQIGMAPEPSGAALLMFGTALLRRR